MNKVEQAVSLFLDGYRCSQAILGTYGDSLGLNQDLGFKLASPFGAGMGSLGNTCGAVTGAFMVLGLKHGNSKTDEAEKKQKAYLSVQEFASKFRERHGSIMCNKLLEVDISTIEGREEAASKDLFKTICPKFVRTAAEILEELL